MTVLAGTNRQWPHILTTLTFKRNAVDEPEVLRCRDRLGQTVELCRASDTNLHILGFQQPERAS